MVQDIKGLFLFTADQDTHHESGNSTVFPLKKGIGNARDAYGIQARKDFLRMGIKGKEGGCDHITGGSHSAVKIEKFHEFVPFTWLMRWAW